MRRKITMVLVAAIAVLGLARGHAWAIGSETPGGGITGTIHDFSTVGSHFGPTTQAVGQCTFCHTPHGALSTQLLWNHTLSQQSYNWDISQTTAGTPFPTINAATWAGPTAKCLSCHDGTVTTGSVNWFDSGHGGANAGAGPHLLNTSAFASLQGLTKGTGGGTLSAVPGTLSGIHPVAFPYPYNDAGSTYNGVTTGSNIEPHEYQNTPLGNVRLYTQSGSQVTLGWNGAAASPQAASTLASSAGIECSSCHDIHNKITKDGYLLVGMATGTGPTYLCNMCHQKY